MGVFTLPILGAIGNLASGLLDRKSAKDQQMQSMSDRSDIRRQDRRWFKEDRKSERDYAEDLTTKDRQYAESQKLNERQYAQEVLLDQRAYDRSRDQYRIEVDRAALKDDRKYMEGRLDGDRAYMEKMRDHDLNTYKVDRNNMQIHANKLAEKSAASRGINFTKLRDDAIAAGYNPMTALSMAHAYSTNVDYQVQGGVYSPGANYTVTGAGYGATSGGGAGGGVGSSGGGGAAPGAVMGSHMPAAGNFSSPGSGYSSQFNPALSSGSFVREAVDRAVDTWSNRPVEKDPLADALRSAFQQDQMAQEVRDSQIPQGFGYDLTKQKQFQPEATIGVSAIPPSGSARMPSGEIEVGGRKFVPVTKPDGKQGRLEASIAKRLDIGPFDTVSPGDWAEIVGEVGEIESLANQPGIRRNVTDEWHIGTTMGDYVKSGVTGSRQFPKGQHYNPWAQ